LSNSVYRISEQVFIEGFKEGALVLRIKDRNIFELNLTAYHVLNNTNGLRKVADIAKLIAEMYKISEKDALDDVVELYKYLVAQDIVERVN
jgi:hypothetical protein